MFAHEKSKIKSDLVQPQLDPNYLSALGLDGWVANDDDAYVAIAQKFASMPSHLETLRAELPARIANSPAGNVAVYAQRVEAGYRQFWRDYCATASGAGQS